MRLLFLFTLFFFMSCRFVKKEAGPVNSADSIQQKPTSVIDTSDFGFYPFLEKFKSAVVNWDTAQIAALTNFPFPTRGPSDEDPTIYYSRKQFIHMFDVFIHQNDGSNSKDTTTELGNLIKTKKSNDLQQDFAAIDDMMFYKENAVWKFSKAYFTKGTVKRLKR